MSEKKNKKIIIFASGDGTNAEQIIKYFKKNKSINVQCILANKHDAGVLERAKKPFGVSSSKLKTIKHYNVNNYVNSLYLRFEVIDKQGVLSLITNRLAKFKISVKRIIQTPYKKK